MTSITITDEKEIEEFKEYCRYKQQLSVLHKNWQEVMNYASEIKNGTFALTIQNGVPVRANKTVQTVIFGLNLTKS